MRDTAQHRIQELAQEFIARLQEIARDEIMKTLGGGGSVSSGRPSLTPSGGRRRALAGRGVKRDANQLEALQSTFLSFVRAHPGLRIEQAHAELGTSTKDLQLPIRKLIAAGDLRTEGQKRSTKYFARGTRKAKKGVQTRSKK